MSSTPPNARSPRARRAGDGATHPLRRGEGGGGGGGDVPSSRGTPDVMRRSRSRASIDEEAVRLAKLEMRRMAEESGDASAGLAGGRRRRPETGPRSGS